MTECYIVTCSIPVQMLPVRVNRYIDTLMDHVQLGKARGIDDILKKLSLTTKQKLNLVNLHFGVLKKQTIIDYAIISDHEEICILFSTCGYQTKNEEIYSTALKKGGPFLSAVESRLSGEILELGYCSICTERSSLYRFDCDHAFCYTCCTHWAKESLSSISIPCPHKDCPVPISVHHLFKLLFPKDMEFHLSLLFRHSLSLMHFKWCPHCSGGGYYDKDHDPNCAVACAYCGLTLCLNCDGFAHIGRSCEDTLKERTQEEQDNVIWKTKNTKQCPQCKVNIEKNQGCPHMTCKSCTYQFCWVCLTKWTSPPTCQCVL